MCITHAVITLYICLLKSKISENPTVKRCLPVTTHVNFTLQFSDTAFDFKVVTKEGGISSASCDITLQSVLLCKKLEIAQ